MIVLVEDKRQERFVRRLFEHLGFEARNLRFNIAPSGRGAAEAWVRKLYPDEVRALRSRNYQKSLGLLAMRDGDAVGVTARKLELDDELRASGLEARRAEERIAVPVPTWSIETWLLHLLGKEALPEYTTFKNSFPRAGERERSAIQLAAEQWPRPSDEVCAQPSIEDARAEIERVL